MSRPPAPGSTHATYSLHLLHWYQRANTDVEGKAKTDVEGKAKTDVEGKAKTDVEEVHWRRVGVGRKFD